jgi:hypothetical protein
MEVLYTWQEYTCVERQLKLVRVITIDVRCHIQGLEHGFSSLVDREDTYTTVVYINRAKPALVTCYFRK